MSQQRALIAADMCGIVPLTSCHRSLNAPVGKGLPQEVTSTHTRIEPPLAALLLINFATLSDIYGPAINPSLVSIFASRDGSRDVKLDAVLLHNRFPFKFQATFKRLVIYIGR